MLYICAVYYFSANAYIYKCWQRWMLTNVTEDASTTARLDSFKLHVNESVPDFNLFNSIQFNSKQFIAEKIQQIHTVHYLPTIHFQGNGDWTPAGVCVP